MKRIYFRISSSNMEPEPDLHTGSGQKVPAPQHWVGLASRLYRTLKGVMLGAVASKTFSRISFVFMNFGVNRDFFTLRKGESQ